MKRFLSAEWFDALESLNPSSAHDHIGEPDLVVERVVTDTPEGEIHYQVVLWPEGAGICRGAGHRSDVRFTSDYSTAAAIASGEVSTQLALMKGQMRVSGSISALSLHNKRLAGLDLVPASLRGATQY